MSAATPLTSTSTAKDRDVPVLRPSPRRRARGGALPVLVSALLFTHAVMLHARSDRRGDDKPVFRDVMGSFANKPVVKNNDRDRNEPAQRGQAPAESTGRRSR